MADFSVDSKKIRESMKKASEDVIAAEPDLTRWDTVSLSLLQEQEIS